MLGAVISCKKMSIYNFSEQIVFNVLPQKDVSTGIQVDVLVSTNSTLLLKRIGNQFSVFPSAFPVLVKDVLLEYKLNRLIIQSSSQSISSYDNSNDNFQRVPDIGTPAGISVLARFVLQDDDDGQTKDMLDLQFTMLLRLLNTFNLLSCGPTPFTTSFIQHQLDPISAGRYLPQHLQFPNPSRKQTSSTTVDYQINLPTASNDVGTFICHDNFEAFLALSSPCHGSSKAGIFGTAGPTKQVLHASPRKHLWIDASTSCFDSTTKTSSCNMSLSQGISYTKFLEKKKENDQVSITIEQLLQRQDSTPATTIVSDKQLLIPCPMASASDIITIIPSSSTSPPLYRQYYPNEITNVSSAAVFSKSDTQIQRFISKHTLLALLPNNTNVRKDTTNGDRSINMLAPWVSFHFLTSNSTADHRPKKDAPWAIHRAHKYVSDEIGTSAIGVGMFQTCIFNGDILFPAQVFLTDFYPSTIIYPLLHTTQLWLYQGGGAGDSTLFYPSKDKVLRANSTKLSMSSSAISDVQFVVAPLSGTLLELTMELPPDSSLCISMEYNHRFLPFDFFPADPNRGMDIPPAFCIFSCPNCIEKPKTPVTLYSSSLLLLPPCPDLTMPFNVICLTSTFYAFVIGSVMNILVRRTSARIKKALGQEEESKNSFKQFVATMKKKIQLFLRFQRFDNNKKKKDE